MARMIGDVHGGAGGVCGHGKGCTCYNYFRGTKMRRMFKRAERQEWKRELRN